MADESNHLPTSRIVRWVAIAGLIAFAIGLYFRDARTLPPLAAPPTTSADTSTN